MLTAADAYRVFASPVDRDAERGHRLCRHKDIRPAFDRRYQAYRAVAGEHGQCEHKTAHKLAADVSGYAECAGGQFAAYRDGAFRARKRQTSASHYVLVYAERPAQKPCASRECRFAVGEQADGEEKAQRTAALTAHKRRRRRRTACAAVDILTIILKRNFQNYVTYLHDILRILRMVITFLPSKN